MCSGAAAAGKGVASFLPDLNSPLEVHDIGIAPGGGEIRSGVPELWDGTMGHPQSWQGTVPK